MGPAQISLAIRRLNPFIERKQLELIEIKKDKIIQQHKYNYNGSELGCKHAGVVVFIDSIFWLYELVPEEKDKKKAIVFRSSYDSQKQVYKDWKILEVTTVTGILEEQLKKKNLTINDYDKWLQEKHDWSINYDIVSKNCQHFALTAYTLFTGQKVSCAIEAKFICGPFDNDHTYKFKLLIEKDAQFKNYIQEKSKNIVNYSQDAPNDTCDAFEYEKILFECFQQFQQLISQKESDKLKKQQINNVKQEQLLIQKPNEEEEEKKTHSQTIVEQNDNKPQKKKKTQAQKNAEKKKQQLKSQRQQHLEYHKHLAQFQNRNST